MSDKNKTKIAVVGIGYVGLSISLLLSKKNDVIAHDVCSKKVDKINKRESPIEEDLIVKALKDNDIFLKATLDSHEAYKDAEYIVICTPTDYDELKDNFNTESLESVISDILNVNSDGLIIIKSTIPIGYTKMISDKFDTDRIIFSPEFLREGKSLFDNLNPSRIIMGEVSERAQKFAEILSNSANKRDIDILLMDSEEAESVKLFSNTYLAMRVAFFNELDTYALSKKLDAHDIIRGVSHDPRIGSHYNNPSFGYGGYCLPKDTKQLRSNFANIPCNLIPAIVESNETRKDFITDEILKSRPKVVGIYRMIMKVGADNTRTSAVEGILQRLKKRNVKVIIYEPRIVEKTYQECKVLDSFIEFKNLSDVILANRYDEALNDVIEKTITRDLTGSD